LTPKFGDFRKLYLYKNKKYTELFAPKTGGVDELKMDTEIGTKRNV
jgi:hypothetical protein